MINKVAKVTLAVIIALLLYTQAQAGINVVAAENFYGNVASLIGGDYVNVTSVISNPDADPHLFTTSTSMAVAINNADVIIYNGAGYDPWIQQLLNAKKSDNRVVIIDVSQLMHIKSSNNPNPHLWYNPNTFPTVAKKLTQIFSELEPKQQKTFALNLSNFNQRFLVVYKKIDEIKTGFKDTPVIATEPIFGYMANALGLKMLGQKFQWVIMNDAEPTPRMLIDYQNLLKQHKVNVLFYNQQVKDNVIKNILTLAKNNQIPSVGVTETMPLNGNVIKWFKVTLADTQQALETTVTDNTSKTTVKSGGHT